MSTTSSVPAAGKLPAASAWELDDLASEGMFATDTDLVVRHWNAWMERHSGRPAEQVVGRRLLELFPCLVERQLDGLYRRALAGEPVLVAASSHPYLLPLPRADRPAPPGRPARLMPQRARIVPLRRQGRVVGTVTTIEDVTVQAEHEQALQREIAVHKALLETSRAALSPDLTQCLNRVVSETAALVGADVATVVLQENGGYRVAACVAEGRLLDCSGTEPAAAAQRLRDCGGIASDAAAKLAAWVEQSSQTVRVADVQTAQPAGGVATLDPQSRSLLGTPLRAGDQVLGALLLEARRPEAFNETEERALLAFGLHAATAIRNARLLQAQRENELRFRTLIETTGSIFVALDAQQRVVEFNRQAERLLGYSRDEVLGRNALELFIAPEHRQQAMELIRRATEGAPVSGFELAVVPRSGPPRTVLWQVARCTDPARHQPCLVWSGLDVTERLQAELQLRQLSQAIEQSPVTVVITDLEARITYVNPAFCRITGYTPQEAMGQNPRILKSGHTRPEEYAQLWANLTSGKEWRGEFHNRRKDGSLYWESAVISPVTDATGRTRAYMAVKEDITARKLADAERERLIAQLQQALAEIKTLKGFIPICAGCKKIRNDKGFWQQVEVYIEQHADVTFSHGLCPDCVKKFYPDVADEMSGAAS